MLLSCFSFKLTSDAQVVKAAILKKLIADQVTRKHKDVEELTTADLIIDVRILSMFNSNLTNLKHIASVYSFLYEKLDRFKISLQRNIHVPKTCYLPKFCFNIFDLLYVSLCVLRMVFLYMCLI